MFVILIRFLYLPQITTLIDLVFGSILRLLETDYPFVNIFFIVSHNR